MPASAWKKTSPSMKNAMVIPASSTAQQTPAKMAFLQIPRHDRSGERLGNSSSFPRAIDPEKPIVASVSGIRSLHVR